MNATASNNQASNGWIGWIAIVGYVGLCGLMLATLM